MLLLTLWGIEETIRYPPAVVDCGGLPSPKFGTVTLSGTTYGSTAVYACNEGYGVVGMAVRLCQANKNWSGTAPTCNRKSSCCIFLCAQCSCVLIVLVEGSSALGCSV